MARLVSADDVMENLSFLEKLTAHLTGEDEYKAAILNNQRVQTEILSQLGGIDMGNHLDPTNVDMDDLPVGLVGTSETAISKGDTGRAIFDISGSKYEARVTAIGDISENETVAVTSSGNMVRPSDAASDALSVMVGAGEAGRNAVMSPQSIGIYETDDLDHANDLGSVVLEPGESEVIAGAYNQGRGGYLLGVGAYNGNGVEYSAIIDGEHRVGPWTNSPLGAVNEPFWFSQSMGGVVKFSEQVEYEARYSSDETGQVELTARLYAQEF